MTAACAAEVGSRSALETIRHTRREDPLAYEPVDTTAGKRHRFVMDLAGGGCAAKNSNSCCREAVPHQRAYDFVAWRSLGGADVRGQVEGAAAAPVEAGKADAIVSLRFRRDKLKALYNLCAELHTMLGVFYGRGARRPVSSIDKRLMLNDVRHIFLRRELDSLQDHLAKTFLQNGEALRQHFFALQGDAGEDSDGHRRGAVEGEAGRGRAAHHSVPQRRDGTRFQLKDSLRAQRRISAQVCDLFFFCPGRLNGDVGLVVGSPAVVVRKIVNADRASVRLKARCLEVATYS